MFRGVSTNPYTAYAGRRGFDVSLGDVTSQYEGAIAIASKQKQNKWKLKPEPKPLKPPPKPPKPRILPRSLTGEYATSYNQLKVDGPPALLQIRPTDAYDDPDNHISDDVSRNLQLPPAQGLAAKSLVYNAIMDKAIVQEAKIEQESELLLAATKRAHVAMDELVTHINKRTKLADEAFTNVQSLSDPSVEETLIAAENVRKRRQASAQERSRIVENLGKPPVVSVTSKHRKPFQHKEYSLKVRSPKSDSDFN